MMHGQKNTKLKNWVFLNGTRGEKMCKSIQKVGSQKRKGQMQMWREYEPWCAQIEDNVWE